MEQLHNPKLQRIVTIALALFLTIAAFLTPNTEEVPSVATQTTHSGQTKMLCPVGAVDAIDCYCEGKDTVEIIRAQVNYAKRTIAVIALFAGVLCALDCSYRSASQNDRVADHTTISHQSMMDVLHRKDGSV